VKYIYISYDGAFSASLGASIHADLIKNIQDNKELEKILIQGTSYKRNFKGNLMYVGCDSKGNTIYCLGTKRVPLVVTRVLKNFEQILNNNSSEIKIIDMRKYDLPLRPYLFFIKDSLMVKIYILFIKKFIVRIKDEINSIKNNGEV
jgi:hypothetical protein